MDEATTTTGPGERPPPRVTAASRAGVARIGAVLLADRYRPAKASPRSAAPTAIAPAATALQPAVGEPRAWMPLPSREARMPVFVAATDAAPENAAAAPGPAAETPEPQPSAPTPDVDPPPEVEPAAVAPAPEPDRFMLPMPHRAAVASPFALRPGQREPALSFAAARQPAMDADQAVGAGDARPPAPPPIGNRGSAATERQDAIARDGGEQRTPRQWLRFALRVVAAMFALWLVASLLAIALFRIVDPPGSMLMAQQRLGGTSIRQTFVPLERISPNLVHAVVASEDSRFCQHWGIDPQEIAAAFERARDGLPRGASTITMQVSKNLFLWPSKSYVRKALEVPLTLAMELLWSKRRIIEVYLNIAEWGPGVFGAEAAAQYHFRKTASALSRREAALLAVSLPNPILRRAGKPGAGLSRLARIIEARMRHVGPAARCTGD